MSRPQSAGAASNGSAGGQKQGYENYDMNGDQASTPPVRSSTPAASRPGENTNIDIFVRVRPVQRPSPRLLLDQTENKVEFHIPRDVAAGYVNNQREHYEFRFNGVIGPEAKQDEVFERVARNVVQGSLEGFNGTIFAYGQTGSGKTFTITGGPMHYADRGIIPRTISHIFSEVSRRADAQISVHVSYLEIYNEKGFDLLDPNREIKSMEDLPQVFVMEDEEGRTGFRNLSMHRANNEEEALNLLFLGDTNRTISETPMNQASSRSHCIFTVYLEARKNGEDTVRRSKLNLVDLAGSERASKTGIDGTTLREAKYINLSLHYLEQVILALQARSAGKERPHIPYRNSMMTQVLRDSLGGNCRTTMVATITCDDQQLDESISTCHFARRVAMVKNVVAMNEEVDPAAIIRRLRQEIRDLREEVRMLKGGQEDRGPLTPDEIRRLQEQIEAYCADNGPDANLNLGGSMLFIRAAFDVFKKIVRAGGLMGPGGAIMKLGGGGGAGGGKDGGGGEGGMDLAESVKKLRLQVAQRDNEINILVGMLKRRDAAAAAGGPAAAAPGLGSSLTTSGGLGAAAGFAGVLGSGPGRPPPGAPGAVGGATGMGGGVSPMGGASVSSSFDASAGGRGSGAAAGGAGGGGDAVSQLLDASMLADRTKAFELFRKSYRQNEVIEENKALLKQKYDAAKELGAAVNDAKGRIGELKALIEQRRIQRSVAGIADPSAAQQDGAQQEDPEEERCKVLIEREKERYQAAFDGLRGAKREIEHLHMLLEQSRVRLARDFEQWMAFMSRQAAAQGGAGPIAMPPAGAVAAAGGSGAATPPRRGLSAAGSGAFSPAASMSSPPIPPAAPRQAWGDSPAASAPSMSATTPTHLSRAASGAPVGGAPAPRPAPAAAPAVPGASPSGAGGRTTQELMASVDPQVAAAAAPYLTGNPDADADILRFYAAKAALMAKLGGGGTAG